MNSPTPSKPLAPPPISSAGSSVPKVPVTKQTASRSAKGGGWGLPIWLLVGILGAGVTAYCGRSFLVNSKGPDVQGNQPVKFSAEPWDGRVGVNQEAQEALALATVPVVIQTEPTSVPLLGTTRHDETKITKIRPLFKGRVDRVHIAVGDHVEIGVPLVDLYSTDLAQAKTTYENEFNQWVHEKHLLDVRSDLRKTNTISEQLLLDTQTEEIRQRHEAEIAREKLVILGLSDPEIEAIATEKGAQRLRLTVRSPAAGVVIDRDVVQGNIYDDSDVLLVIAPEDHLWVWGNVFERDLSLVELGQKWDVQFSFLKDRLSGVVEYISPGVDPLTHAVKIRTSIPNPEHRLKSEMLARGALQVPPKLGCTVIPRTAMIVVDGSSFAFVRDPQDREKFLRHKLSVAHESDDRVVLDSGLRPGEEVVVIGGLILQQLYSELEILETGRAAGNSNGTPHH